jgi:hypothetical protein
MLLAPAHALAYGQPGFGGCMIATGQGALADADCDRAPDPFDNCPLTPNAAQSDVDKNNIGDACDLIIEEIRIEPEQPMQGRSMVMHVSLINNRAYPMRNIVVKAEAPTLNMNDRQDMHVVGPGERIRAELVMRVPECAPTRSTQFVAIAEYPYAPGQNEIFSQGVRAAIASSGLCGGIETSDKTIVDIMELQDVDAERGALYPFTIKNMQEESRAYVLSVDAEPWGAVELNPGSVIVVPAGGAREGAIQVWARPGVSGRQTMTFTIQAKDDVKQVVLMANVPDPITPVQYGPPPLIILGTLIALVVIGGIVLAIFWPKSRPRKR